MSRTPLGVLLAASTLLASRAEAQLTYDLVRGTGSLVSIAGTGTPLNFSSTDDGVATFASPFAFDFFGAPIAQATPVTVDTNGLVNFEGAGSDFGNDQIPSPSSPNSFIAAYWDDMSVSGAAGYWSVTGSPGSRVLAIEWNRFKRLSSADELTAQIRIYEADDRIEILYGARIGSGGTGSVGVEGPLGTLGAGLPCSPSCSYADVAQGTRLTFNPIPVPPAAIDLVVSMTGTPPSSVVPGSLVELDYTVLNRGTELAGPSEVALIAGSMAPVALPGATIITTMTVPALAGGDTSSGIFSTTVPTGFPAGSTWYLAAVADARQAVSEIDEGNNTTQIGGVIIGDAPMGTIRISTRTLPPARASDPYDARLAQTGATAPRWSIISGSLPSGLSLSAAGVIGGTPVAPGTSAFRVECSQMGYAPGYASLTIEVADAGAFAITTRALPEAQVGQMYSAQVAASGGMAPYAFQAVRGAPAWMRIVSDGTVSGTPTEIGSHSIEISAFDSALASTSAVLSLEVIVAGPLRMLTTPDRFTAGQVGVPYEVRVEAQGGARPYGFVVSGGQLPPGLALAQDTGILSGIPAVEGESMFTISVLDAAQASVSVSATVRVTRPIPLAITVPDKLVLPFDMPVNQPLGAEGGTPPYVWSIASGALPPGLALTNAAITGVATASVTAQLTLAVDDAVGAQVQKAVEIEVRTGGAPPGGGTRGGTTRGGGGTRRDDGCRAAGADLWGALLAVLAVFAWRRRGGLAA